VDLPYDSRGAQPQRAEPVVVSGTIAGDGTLTLTLPPVPEGRRWKVNYITVTTGGTQEPTVDVYVDSADLRNLLDGTDTGLSAVAVYNPPRIITQGEQLVLRWVGAQAGAQAGARIEYDIEPA
jgi:hypothetical protein